MAVPSKRQKKTKSAEQFTYEIVVRCTSLSLLDVPTTGEQLSAQLVLVLGNELGVITQEQKKSMIAVSRDRASVNKVAIQRMKTLFLFHHLFVFALGSW